MSDAWRVCSRCGSCCPPAHTTCEMCSAEIGPDGLTADPPRPDGQWARLEARFHCTSCAFLSPINHLDIGDTLTCAHCGLEQPFEHRAWERILARSHEVVDLAGVAPWVAAAPPSTPLVRDNPYKHVGTAVPDRRWTENGVVGEREGVDVRVAPGVPLCDECHGPLDVAPGGGEETLATCTSCGVHATYRLPSPLPYPLRALLADEHRTDRAAARLEADAEKGVANLACPTCGARLSADGTASTVSCDYCHALAYVSDRHWYRIGVRAPRTLGWWVQFEGPSPRRVRLERAADDVDPLQAEIAARARAARQAAAAAAPATTGAPFETSLPGSEPATSTPPTAEPGPAGRKWALLVLALLALIGAAVVAVLV